MPVDALVRPYPIAITGVPTSLSFDPASRTLDFSYTTERPDGGRYADRHLDTIVFVPSRHYPDGYVVKAPNARVTSKRCASRLTLRMRHPGRPVTVHLTPRAPSPPSRPFCR